MMVLCAQIVEIFEPERTGASRSAWHCLEQREHKLERFVRHECEEHHRAVNQKHKVLGSPDPPINAMRPDQIGDSL